ncbi:MAG: transglutaminase N-terminal domain-containing protein [Beijerinckiaceae bacterium]
MRILVRHETIYRYDTPARSVNQVLRLTPRNHEGQHIVSWRIDIDADCRLMQSEDHFGNIVHSFSLRGPLPELRVLVEGEAETFDTAGVVRGTRERFPPELFLRQTDLTTSNEALRRLALNIQRTYNTDLDRLHGLLQHIHQTMSFDTDPTHSATTAAEAWDLQRGVCQDFSHIFITCARQMDIPARFVGGHFLRTDGVESQQAGHAWAEAFVAGLGWVGFDPAHGVSVHDCHVRVASGLDYLGAAPVRGIRTGGSVEDLEVVVRVSQAGWQSQS